MIFKLIVAASDHGNTSVALSCSRKKKDDVKIAIQNVYKFFVAVVDGLPGKSPEQQDMWRSGLVDFLRKSSQLTDH